MDEWISVEERLPEFGEACLVYVDNTDCDGRKFINYDWGTRGWPHFHNYGVRVTHWRKLPEPPKEKGTETADLTAGELCDSETIKNPPPPDQGEDGEKEP